MGQEVLAMGSQDLSLLPTVPFSLAGSSKLLQGSLTHKALVLSSFHHLGIFPHSWHHFKLALHKTGTPNFHLR